MLLGYYQNQSESIIQLDTLGSQCLHRSQTHYITHVRYFKLILFGIQIINTVPPKDCFPFLKQL